MREPTASQSFDGAVPDLRPVRAFCPLRNIHVAPRGGAATPPSTSALFAPRISKASCTAQASTKTVRFEATPASAIVSPPESEDDATPVAAPLLRKLDLAETPAAPAPASPTKPSPGPDLARTPPAPRAAPSPSRLGAATLGWVLLAAFLARDVLSPTPRPAKATAPAAPPSPPLVELPAPLPPLVELPAPAAAPALLAPPPLSGGLEVVKAGSRLIKAAALPAIACACVGAFLPPGLLRTLFNLGRRLRGLKRGVRAVRSALVA